MRCLLTLALLALAAWPAAAQENEAEKLYRAMAEKILAAKSLALEFNSEMTVDDKKFTVKGTIYVAADNKTRLELESELFGGGKTLIVTNGESSYMKTGDLVYDKDKGPFAPKGEVLLALIARGSAVQAAMAKKIATADLGKDWPVKNFELGVKEMVGKREAQVVQYQIQDKKIGDLTEVSVWIDTKTQLPLKLAMARKEKGNEFRLTETYSVFTVDSKLDGKLFEIPPKISGMQGFTGAKQELPKQELPKPVPPKLVKPWREAGADAWWTHTNFQQEAFMNSYGIVMEDKNDMGKGPPGELPVFRFSEWKDGVVPRLPDPGVPFAIELNDPKISDAVLKDLAGLKSLRWLNLYGTEVTGVGFKDLTELKDLQLLMLGHTKVNDEGLKEVGRLTSLQTLILSDTKITDAGMKDLAKIKNLKTLYFNETSLSDKGMKELAGLQNLEVLGLWGTKVTDAGLKDVTGFKKLRLLCLTNVPVTDRGLKVVAECQNLEELYLAGTNVGDDGMKTLTGLKKLRWLDLGATKVTDAGLKGLAGMNLIYLMDIPDQAKTDLGLKHYIGALDPDRTTNLRLEGWKITDAGLKELTVLKNLGGVDLTGTAVTDAGLKELAKVKGLLFLTLTKTKVTDAGVKALQKELPKCEITR